MIGIVVVIMLVLFAMLLKIFYMIGNADYNASWASLWQKKPSFGKIVYRGATKTMEEADKMTEKEVEAFIDKLKKFMDKNKEDKKD